MLPIAANQPLSDMPDLCKTNKCSLIKDKLMTKLNQGKENDISTLQNCFENIMQNSII